MRELYAVILAKQVSLLPTGPELTQSGEIKAQYFDASTTRFPLCSSLTVGQGHANKDIAFLHTDSKTLIQADLLFNLPAIESVRRSF